jgi:cytochrome P450
VTITHDREIYYDPFDVHIDVDPHPLWKRMRDEAPLYRNEKYTFWALTRFDDVEKALVDWDNFRSGKGSTLEMILSGMEMPPGSILMEDPPAHDVHRSLMSRVFTPKAMLAIEPKVREFCRRTLDPLMGEGKFDFITDLGAIMPMLTIGMLLGIPEEDQVAIRDRIDAGLRIEGDGDDVPSAGPMFEGIEIFGDYVDHRIAHPADDLMTKLVTTEFEDEHGVTRTLTRDEALMYIMLLAGAGNETTTRLIGWTGKLLAEHPDQRHLLADDPSLIPAAIEEILRLEPPGPHAARYVTRDVEYYGSKVPAGSVMMFMIGAANRDHRRFTDPDRLDVRRELKPHLTFGYGIHACIGRVLARLEGRIALEELLKRFRDWEIDYPNAVLSPTSTVRGWETLPAIVRAG